MLSAEKVAAAAVAFVGGEAASPGVSVASIKLQSLGKCTVHAM